MPPRVSLVVAMAENNVIGKDGGLPWHIPADLMHFKAVTMGKPIVMGRRTYESIGRPLPGRLNIVVTRDPSRRWDGVEVVQSLPAALERAAAHGADEIMVIGGGDLYRAALPLAQRIYLTRVHEAVEGDTVFPDLDPAEWREDSCDRRDDIHRVPVSFEILERIGAGC
jgi:dihydrofolate reductase